MNVSPTFASAPNAASVTGLRHIALVGNPNAGKSALFNALTGGRQKVANYPGVTVERKSARLALPDGQAVELIDLPGTYSLNPRSPDEEVTRNVVMGLQTGEDRPAALVCVVNATNLRNHLRFVLELKRLGLPMVVALNMIDLAERDGTHIDVEALSAALDLPVFPTVAVRKRGLGDLLAALPPLLATRTQPARSLPEHHEVRELQSAARAIAARAITAEGMGRRLSRRIDSLVLHPVAGPLILAAVLFLVFQAVFSWAETPMEWIDQAIGVAQAQVNAAMTDGWLKSLIADGILAGVGSVIVFLPQILILFLFILLLEQCGYMTRAAFLMDRIMASVGLNGRAFIPLLSSFACAIPGIMATRTIDNPRDRMTTILIAPLMTCSARLPVYTVIIAAFIPNIAMGGAVGLQGLVLFILYLSGVASALVVAAILRRTVIRGHAQPLLMEMPHYQLPALRDIAIGLYQRAAAFLQRAGTIILASMIVLWALASFPTPPPGATGPAIDYSFVGALGRVLEVVFAPIGFNREIAVALVPGMAAREVAVGALGTVYSLQGAAEGSLVDVLRNAWSLPTALAFLAWYVFAPQCLSTLAITRRETNSWRWPTFMFLYLFALAYAAAGLTYWLARALLGA